MRHKHFPLNELSLYAAVVASLWLAPKAQAKYIGGDPPKCATCPCTGCTRPSVSERSNTTSSVSRTEGNVTEQVSIATVRSSTGPTLDLSVTYNSYNADGSRATVNTVLGYGWTHSYNIFLFGQLGALFRYDGDGRVTRYKLGPNGTFIAATGYFETLTQSGTTFTLTQKDQTKYTFMPIPGTPFLVNGPAFRLTQIKDRNGNITTLTYSGGNLKSVTDTYGRAITFTYNAQNQISSVKDPAGRVTTFQYDSTGHLLTKINDPIPHSIQYTYDTQYQLTTKTDQDGRLFRYSYDSNGLPVAVYDANGTGPATLSNPGEWATDATQLAMNQLRVYVPSTTTNTDGRGNAWKYIYDSNGYLTQTVAPDGATTTYAYDPATLQLASMTDANKHPSNYQYDANGNRIQMTDALGHVTKYTYDPVFNRLTSRTDPRGRVTMYTIDPANGNRTKETDPLGSMNQWTYDSHGNLLAFTDKDGHTTTYQYDAFGNRTKITDPVGNMTTMTYDPVGNMTSMTDARLNTTSFQYDGLNRLTVVTDATAHTDQTFYDGEGNRAKTIDRNGHSTSFQYDLRQRLIQTTDALGHPETYAYDANDNRVSLTDRNTHTTSYRYDVQNRLTNITDALGDITITTYDGVGNVISVTDADGHTTSYSYDPLNRRSTMTDAAGDKTQYFYDTGTFSVSVRGVTCNQCGATPGSSLVTEQIDPDGSAGLHAGVTFYKYDALDRLIIQVRKVNCIGAGCPDTIVGTTCPEIVDSNDAVTSYAYDPVGNRLSLTEPDCNTTTYAYDPDNRLITETNAAGDVTNTSYDPVSNVKTVTAPTLNVTTNIYDALNRLIEVDDSVGLVATYGYDPVGNRTSQGDGDGHITTYAYDPLNRLIKQADPLGKSTQYQYDFVGNLTEVIDRNLNPTIYTYDAINRRLTMTDALGNLTQYQYDPVGNLTKLTDANGHATQYFYDPVNRPLQEIYADGLSRFFAHDNVSNLIKRTDQIGQVTNYTYNDLYFLTSRTYPSAINDTFTYDLSGRMLSGQRGTWLDTFTYDGANRITQTVQNGHAISYIYNVPGRIRTLTYPGGRVITEHTDARARMDHIDDVASPPPIVQYTYDLANNVLSRNYRNGTTSSFSYNANNWTTSMAYNNPATFEGFSYTYDNEGNKQFEQKTHDSSHSECYAYDSTYRLISYKVGSLVGSCVPAPVTQTSYNLDPVGNWTSKTTDGVTQNRMHNATNELIKIDSTSLIYDDNGNLTNEGTYTYTYDEENRLTKATRNSASAVVGQYQYDALNRRVQKIANPAGTLSIVQYFYDDARIIEEQNGAGITQATYVYGNYIDEVLTMNRGANTYYYHQNALGSVEAITDQTAAPVERYSYDAYGFATMTNGAFNPIPPNAWGTPHSAIGNPWMFTGRQLDEETGLYYYRARYYDPVKGRFLQRDPLEYLDGANLYEYGDDNPIRFGDPTGFTPLTGEARSETFKRIQAGISDKGYPSRVPEWANGDQCYWEAELRDCRVTKSDLSRVKPTGVRVEEIIDERTEEVSLTVKSSVEISRKYGVKTPGGVVEADVTIKHAVEEAKKIARKWGTKVSMQFYVVSGRAIWTERCKLVYVRRCKADPERIKGQEIWTDYCAQEYYRSIAPWRAEKYRTMWLQARAALENLKTNFSPTGETIEIGDRDFEYDQDISFLMLSMPGPGPGPGMVPPVVGQPAK
jgi:RHS repeat-associated protein